MPDRQPRAVIVTPVLPFPPASGGHKRTLRLVEAIAAAGTTPQILTEEAAAPEAVATLRDRGWLVELLPEAPPTLASRAAQHLRRLPSPYLHQIAGRLREVARDAAFIQFENAQSAYYFDAARPARTVLSMHNVDSQVLASVMRGSTGLARLRAANRALATRTVERRAAPRANLVITVSEHDRRHFERHARSVLVIPNGIDDAFFEIPPALPPAPEVLFVGNLGYAPNALGITRFLREGWPRLLELAPAAHLEIVGAGISPALAELVSASERVATVGFVDDLVGTLARSRVVVAPLWQGGGTKFKVLEALASARPLAATPHAVSALGATPGAQVEVAEDPLALAELIAMLLSDEPRSLALAARARDFAEPFRWSRATAPLEDVYRDWVATSSYAASQSATIRAAE